MARGMQARALFRRKRAQAIVQRQMLFFLTRAFVASAKVARKIREEMRKKHVRQGAGQCLVGERDRSGFDPWSCCKRVVDLASNRGEKEASMDNILSFLIVVRSVGVWLDGGSTFTWVRACLLSSTMG